MENKSILFDGKKFDFLFSEETLQARIIALAEEVENYFPIGSLFIPVLNGGFWFASDLFRNFSDRYPYAVEFIKTHSYEGTESSGTVHFDLLPTASKLKDKHIVLVDDIIDTGLTFKVLKNELLKLGAKSVSFVALFNKFMKNDCGSGISGFMIKDEFVIGYGLDYVGRFRNLKDVYHLVKEEKE